MRHPFERASRSLLLALVTASCATGGDAGRLDPLAAEEVSLFDGVTGDLVPINWLTASEDRTLAAAQPQDGYALLLDSLLQVRARFGRQGSGPGEFAELSLGDWLGDSLWIFDGALRRFTIGSAAGQFGRTFPAPALQVDTNSTVSRFSFYSPVGLLPGDTLIAVAPPLMDAPASQPERRQATLFMLTADGRPVRSIGRVAEDKGRVEIVAEGFSPGATMRTPFHASPLWSVSTEARRVSMAETRFVNDRSGTFVVTMMDLRGDTIYARTFPFTAPPIPRAAMDSALRRLFPPTSPSAATLTAQLDPPSSYPPLSELLLGRDGTTWVGLYPHGPSRTWLVLDADGEPLGQVSLPSTERLRAATASDAWVTRPNADGVESIVRYRITVSRRAH